LRCRSPPASRRSSVTFIAEGTEPSPCARFRLPANREASPCSRTVWIQRPAPVMTPPELARQYERCHPDEAGWAAYTPGVAPSFGKPKPGLSLGGWLSVPLFRSLRCSPANRSAESTVRAGSASHPGRSAFVLRRTGARGRPCRSRSSVPLRRIRRHSPANRRVRVTRRSRLSVPPRQLRLRFPANRRAKSSLPKQAQRPTPSDASSLLRRTGG
jgi:hypothetical protein